MNTDQQDIIASSSVKAFNAGYAAGKREAITDDQTVIFFNAGYQAGKRHVLDAVETVTFEHHDLEVAAISDLQEELKIKEDLQLGKLTQESDS